MRNTIHLLWTLTNYSRSHTDNGGETAVSATCGIVILRREEGKIEISQKSKSCKSKNLIVCKTKPPADVRRALFNVYATCISVSGYFGPHRAEEFF